MRNKLVFLILAIILCASCSNKNESPNIIYILADDLGIGDVQAFNPEGKIPTPHLNQLAEEGMIFTDAHTSSAVCTPTRYGILTGRYNWRSKMKKGVLNGRSTALIPDDRETVASLLQKAGYKTAFIGKWHLGWNWTMDKEGHIDFSKKTSHDPNTVGFEYAFGHPASLDMPPYVYVENGMTTAIPIDTTVNTTFQGFWRKGLTAPDFDHEKVTPLFFSRTMEYIEEQAGKDNPFFVYLALPSPHTPILPTAEWKGKSLLNPYGDFVMMIDNYVGKINLLLKELGISENTILIFTSDNGCSPRADYDDLISKGHNPSSFYRGHKADIFEGGHRVPFIAKWPVVINPGSKTERTICTTDFFATCADISNQSFPDEYGEDSYSMIPLFKEKPQKYKRNATVHHSISGEFAIRVEDYKLILCPGSGGWSYPTKRDSVYNTLPDFQLYNLTDDPGEKDNLINEMPEKVDELKKFLSQIITNGRSTEGKNQKNDGPEKWEQLDFID